MAFIELNEESSKRVGIIAYKLPKRHKMDVQSVSDLPTLDMG
jgi:hypothetical protein